jgi:hypothetical protein
MAMLGIEDLRWIAEYINEKLITTDKEVKKGYI